MKNETERLVDALRDDAEWAHANEWETPITLGDNLDAAANTIEKLSSDLDAWKQLAEAAKRDIRSLIENTDSACDFCTHRRVCKGCENEKTCSTDFEFGTCPAMKDTPCNGCGLENHFQWRGPCAENGGEPHGHHA